MRVHEILQTVEWQVLERKLFARWKAHMLRLAAPQTHEESITVRAAIGELEAILKLPLDADTGLGKDEREGYRGKLNKRMDAGMRSMYGHVVEPEEVGVEDGRTGSSGYGGTGCGEAGCGDDA